MQNFYLNDYINTESNLTGVNLLVWTNTTPYNIQQHQKFKIIATHYDTTFWREKGSLKAAYEHCSGVSLLLDLIVELELFYKSKPQIFEHSAKRDEDPYLFIFFDHAQVIFSKFF